MGRTRQYDATKKKCSEETSRIKDLIRSSVRRLHCSHPLRDDNDEMATNNSAKEEVEGIEEEVKEPILLAEPQDSIVDENRMDFSYEDCNDDGYLHYYGHGDEVKIGWLEKLTRGMELSPLLLYRSSKFIFSGKTVPDLDDEDELIELVNSKKIASERKNVLKLINEVYNALRIESFKSCPNCYEKIEKYCVNRRCTMNRVMQKRSKLQQYIETDIFSLRKHLEVVLADELPEILDFHASVHRGLSTERTGCRYSDGYMKRIESQEEFENGEIVLLLSFAFDAYQGRVYSKLSFNNFYVKLDSLRAEKVQKPENICLFAQQRSRSKIGSEGYREIGLRLSEELSFLTKVGFKYSVNGRSWTIKFKLFYAAADLAGISESFDFGSWRSANGCHRCSVVGVKKGQCMKFDSTVMMTSRKPSHYDPFNQHLDSTTPKWPRRKLLNRQIVSIEKSLLTLVNYTDDSVQILSFREFRNLTGNEVQKLCGVLLPLIVAENMLKCVPTNVHLIAYITFCWLCSTQKYLAKAKALGIIMAKIHSIVSVDSFTLKSHATYFHYVDDIVEYGYENSTTEWCERQHHEIQANAACFATKTSQIIKNSVVKSTIYHMFLQQSASSGNRVLSKMVDRMNSSKEPKSRFRTNYGYLCETGIVNLDSDDVKIEFFREHVFVFGSRCVIGNSTFHSYKYWKRAKTTDASRIMYQIDGSYHFGIIRFFAYSDSYKDITCVVDCMESDGIIDSVYNNDQRITIMDHRLVSACDEAIGIIKSVPPTIVQFVKNGSIDIVRISDVVCPFIDCTFSGQTYFIPQYHVSRKMNKLV